MTSNKTPVLSADEARALLDAIDTSILIGLRDRALIGVMVYSFARITAVLQMKVGTISFRDCPAGYAYTRRAARSMRFPAITAWKATWTPTLPLPASSATGTSRYFTPAGAKQGSRTL